MTISLSAIIAFIGVVIAFGGLWLKFSSSSDAKDRQHIKEMKEYKAEFEVLYVQRKEYEIQYNNIKESLDEIKDNLKGITALIEKLRK